MCLTMTVSMIRPNNEVMKLRQRCQPAKFKKGRRSSKIRENTCDRYIRQTDRAEGVLVALGRLNNTTILLTVLIFVLFRHVRKTRICDCRIFGTLPHFSHILAK